VHCNNTTDLENQDLVRHTKLKDNGDLSLLIGKILLPHILADGAGECPIQPNMHDLGSVEEYLRNMVDLVLHGCYSDNDCHHKVCVLLCQKIDHVLVGAPLE
jgi:hypothetical protein